MPLAALLGEFDLLLPVAVTLSIGVAAPFVAMRTGDAFLEVPRLQVLALQRFAAGVAQDMLAFRRATETLVEDEAGAFPQALFLGNFLGDISGCRP